MTVEKHNQSKTTREKGSALLVSLMVMVGLSLLGLGFVAISETESAIAGNERNYTQAQAAAEAGAKIAIEWFQDAVWADEHKLLPPNNVALKTERNLVNGSETYKGYYKANAGELLFDIPFKITKNNKLYGNVNSADIAITYKQGGTDVATKYLDTLNAKLFSDKSLRISDIRVYAPPVPGGTIINTKAGVSDSGFWAEGPTRFGLATVRVTAQKLAIRPDGTVLLDSDGDARVLAERSVKLVLAETPFPTVDGAIETSGSLVGQGNFHVYWGKILSEKNTQWNRPAVGMPWLDAKEHLPFEYGYDSTEDWKINTAYEVGDLVNAPNSEILLDAELGQFAYRCVTAGTSAGASPGWAAAKTVGSTVTEGTGVQWRAEASRQFRVAPTEAMYTDTLWLYALLEQGIEDPWLHARARREIVIGNSAKLPCDDGASPHPCDFATVNESVSGRLSNVFQHQNFTDTSTSHPERIEVFFPTMDYEFWKTVAQSGDNQAGNDLYFFKYDAVKDQFIGPGGYSKPVEDWLNAKLNGLGAGFYFFDTANGKNPQYGKGGTLTPGIAVSAQDGKNWQMQGYVYLNAEAFGTTGQGNMVEDDVYNMPGEPFRDVGYRKVDVDGKNYELSGAATLPDGEFQVIGANNDVWDFQDVNQNGVFDWYVALNTKVLKRPNSADIPVGTVWLPVPWREGCTVPDLSDMKTPVWPNPADACSEPHEPYINFQYPDKGNPKDGVTAGWTDPNAETFRKPKRRTGVNTGENCTDESSLRVCTSNGYDVDGALVTLAPILYGALYNEGGYSGSGNAVYYGAVLMRGNFDASGSPEVFFNECLARGCLESQLEMQRVMVTSYETDQ